MKISAARRVSIFTPAVALALRQCRRSLSLPNWSGSRSRQTSPGQTLAETSSASSPSISAPASMAASGSVRTPRSPTSAASAATWSPRSRRIKVPNVRWPGGCFADEYHWRNGIGPRDQRPATLNPNWGGVIEPNTLRHPRIHGFRRPDRRRGLSSRSMSARARVAGSRGLAGVHDAPTADHARRRSAPPTAIRRRTRSHISASATRAGAAAAR